MPRSITLLSDFGLQDSYVGILKGAIAQINPAIQVIDLTHDISPQDIAAARFNLMNAYPYFPAGTVHVAIVDPGVGSARRAIAVELSDGFLVAPDNGVLSGVLQQFGDRVQAAVELTNPTYWRVANPSLTFHGRDIFAPVAAHLASGAKFLELGDSIEIASLTMLPIAQFTEVGQSLTGCIQHIDRFGNLITNIPGAAIQGDNWSIAIDQQVLPGQKTYADRAVGELVALVGSHQWIEIAVNCGSAQDQLKQAIGNCIEVTRYSPRF